MRTHREVVERALTVVGVARLGEAVQGNVYDATLKAFQDRILSLHEMRALDFDPTDETAVPEERVPALVDILTNDPILAIQNPNHDPSGVALRLAEARLYKNASPSDFLDVEPEDF